MTDTNWQEISRQQDIAMDKANARIAELEQQVSGMFSAADMSTARADGFKEGEAKGYAEGTVFAHNELLDGLGLVILEVKKSRDAIKAEASMLGVEL